MKRTLLLAFLACVAACAPASVDSVERTETQASSIINGADALDPKYDSVISIATEVEPGLHLVCTAVVVAPNLLLTARHCVSDALADNVHCDASGEPIEDGSGQGFVRGEFDLAKIRVYVSNKPPPVTKPPNAIALKLVHDKALTVCSHDLAAVITSTNLTAPAAKIRLKPPVVAEMLTLVGFGATRTQLIPGVRQFVEVPISGIGPDVPGPKGAAGISPRTFESKMAMCNGDSGGPTFVGGAVVGIASRIANRNTNPNENGCYGDQVRSIYTRVSDFAGVLDAAFKEAKAEPLIDGPRIALGGSCRYDIECDSSLCSLAPGAPSGMCAQSCELDPTCPEGYACTNNICILAPKPAPSPSTPPPNDPPNTDQDEQRPRRSDCVIGNVVGEKTSGTRGAFFFFLSLGAIVGLRWRSMRAGSGK